MSKAPHPTLGTPAPTLNAQQILIKTKTRRLPEYRLETSSTRSTTMTTLRSSRLQSTYTISHTIRDDTHSSGQMVHSTLGVLLGIIVAKGTNCVRTDPMRTPRADLRSRIRTYHYTAKLQWRFIFFRAKNLRSPMWEFPKWHSLHTTIFYRPFNVLGTGSLPRELAWVSPFRDVVRSPISVIEYMKHGISGHEHAILWVYSMTNANIYTKINQNIETNKTQSKTTSSILPIILRLKRPQQLPIINPPN